MTTSRPFRLNGWHVLGILVAFFAAVTAVDEVMIVDAYRSFPGEVSSTPYEDGLAFDSELAQQHAQTVLGWRMTAGFDGPATVTLAARDRDGRPLSLARIDARLERPATEAGRLPLKFVQVAPGLYRAAVGRLDGAWDLSLSAYDAHHRRFDAQRRLVVP